MWEEREAQWEKERKARERLMQEVDRAEIPVHFQVIGRVQQLISVPPWGKVLAERQQQLAMKIQKNREAQEESRRRREELIKELETQRSLSRQDRENQESRRTAWLQEVHAQVGSLCSVFCTLLKTMKIQFQCSVINVVIGGAEAPGAIRGATPDRTRRGGGRAGSSSPGGGAEVGDGEDGGERTPGEGKLLILRKPVIHS